MGTDFITIRDIAQAVEGIGFDNLATNDHVVGGHPDRAGGERMHAPETPVHEPLVLLSFIGAVTTRLELVTAILLLPQRQTTLVAKQVAELDLLSNGRVRLGVGVGRNWMEYEALNENSGTGGNGSKNRSRCSAATGPRNWSPSRGDGTHWIGAVSTRCRSSGRSRSGWAHSSVSWPSRSSIRSAGWPTAGCRSFRRTSWPRSWSGSGSTPGLRPRDPSEVSIEYGPVGADQNPDQSIERATAYLDLGATHLKVMANPAGSRRRQPGSMR